MRHAGGATVNYYHGFTQAAPFDRQLFRILCERGDIELHEWVPTEMIVNALLDDSSVERLHELLPDARVETEATFSGDARDRRARQKSFAIDRKMRFSSGNRADKMHRYAEILQAMFADQAAWIRDRGHHRKITEANGRESVAMAVAATDLARNSE